MTASFIGDADVSAPKYGTSIDSSRIVSGPDGSDLAVLTDRVEARVRDQPAASAIAPRAGFEDVDQLARARRLMSSRAVTAHIGWHTPIVGPLLARLRTLFFSDARAYVDAHLARQAEIDRSLIGTIDDLRAEIVELKATIDRTQRVE